MQYFQMGSFQYKHLVVCFINEHIPSTKEDIVYHQKKLILKNILFISTWLFQLNLTVHEDTFHLRGEVN